MKLKIYSNKQYLPSGQKHNVILLPFWGKNPEMNQISTGRFNRYATIGSQYFKMVPLKKADLVILPGEWLSRNPNVLAYKLAAAAKDFDKPLVIFFNSDSDETILIKNSFVFRTSFYRSTRQANEFSLPAWSEDFVEKYCQGKLQLRQYRPTPIVSYCGLSSNFKEKLKNEIGRKLFPRFQPSGHYLRWQVLKKLSKDKNIKTSFIIRREFWNGLFRKNKWNKKAAFRSRYEFVQNIIDSDYVLCTRGSGNFSYRLYEILSLGRIPIFIDTDCVLPYNSYIDWKKFVVWVDQKEIGRVAERVADFHTSLSPVDFQKLQLACRKLWEEWLSPQGFFANFHKHFTDSVCSSDTKTSFRASRC